ncbi:MAG: 50S ribosomal protein L1, partial [Candidatus Omnitrophota bacterium]
MRTQSKRYKESVKQVGPEKLYQLKEAIAILKKLPKPKFDGSVDLHFNLGVDTKKSDQMIRGTVVLP